MDHASAHLIEYPTGDLQSRVVTSKFTSQEKSQSLGKGENLMHNQEQRMHAAYYKQIAEAILNYEQVVIFGPTHAKEELANLLKEDHRYSKIRIDVKRADQLTEPQEYAFVRDFFDAPEKGN